MSLTETVNRERNRAL